jgi:hypothetical protein
MDTLDRIEKRIVGMQRMAYKSGMIVGGAPSERRVRMLADLLDECSAALVLPPRSDVDYQGLRMRISRALEEVDHGT